MKNTEKIVLPFIGVKEVEIESGNLFTLLSHKVVYEARWGFKKGKLSDDEYKNVIEKTASPLLAEFIDKIQKEKLLQTHGTIGLFKCVSEGDKIFVLEEAGLVIGEFDFPRQKKTPYLCLSDFVSEDGNDVIAFWSVTVGNKYHEETKKLYESGNYRNYHLLHGLGAELADCGAAWLHRLIHRELFPYKLLTDNKPMGCRYSFGYPSCPELKNQNELMRLLGGENKTRIKLTENYMMVPELSVAGFILFNKNARYFVL